ncbi:MAG TPA: DUF167 domain-containing protein [Acidimicrobiales bacterium]|nr:DUF167 domain-containing protein [Acidimicrobiales bacterium]
MSEDLFDVIEGESGAEPVLRLRVHVRPGAGKSAVVGTYGDSLHLRVAAPPVDGRANKACAELLADVLSLPSDGVVLVTGDKSANKRFELRGVDAETLRRRLHEVLEEVDNVPGSGRGKRRGRP